jgi:hypothetical protein
MCRYMNLSREIECLISNKMKNAIEVLRALCHTSKCIEQEHDTCLYGVANFQLVENWGAQSR